LIADTIEKVRPLLAGKGPAVQGAVLADLLAMWLAGHWIPGEVEETKEAREASLAHFVETVWQLVGVNAQILGTDK
jgi:hypothetical protein